jgi:hypothetical protein
MQMQQRHHGGVVGEIELKIVFGLNQQEKPSATASSHRSASIPG